MKKLLTRCKRLVDGFVDTPRGAIDHNFGTESSQSMSRMPAYEAAARIRHMQVDIVVAVLFLPVALAFQELVHTVYGDRSRLAVSSVFEGSVFVTAVLGIWIFEALAISTMIYQPKSAQQRIAGIAIFPVFVASVTLMSIAHGTEFQVFFVVSVIAAFVGPVLFYDWNLGRNAGENANVIIAFIVLLFTTFVIPFLIDMPADQIVDVILQGDHCQDQTYTARITDVKLETNMVPGISSIGYVVLRGVATRGDFTEYAINWAEISDVDETLDEERFVFREPRGPGSVLQSRPMAELKRPGEYRVSLEVLGTKDTAPMTCKVVLRVR